MREIENMISVYGLPGSFGSRVRSKYIGHKNYAGRNINLYSKLAPIHGPLHRSDFNYS